jgi:hypothetical protein
VLRVGQTVSTEDEDAVSVVVHGQVVTRGEKLRKGRQWLLYRRREGEGWDGGGCLACCGEKWEGAACARGVALEEGAAEVGGVWVAQ